jgi:hypothetical protein
MPGTVLPAFACRHAARAALATFPNSPFSAAGLEDAVNRAVNDFTLDAEGQLVSRSGETLEDWVDRLRETAGHLFNDNNLERQRPAHFGRVGDGRANHRLSWANQWGTK